MLICNDVLYLRNCGSLFSWCIPAKVSSKQTTLVVSHERAHTSMSVHTQTSLIKEPRGR